MRLKPGICLSDAASCMSSARFGPMNETAGSREKSPGKFDTLCSIENPSANDSQGLCFLGLPLSTKPTKPRPFGPEDGCERRTGFAIRPCGLGTCGGFISLAVVFAPAISLRIARHELAQARERRSGARCEPPPLPVGGISGCRRVGFRGPRAATVTASSKPFARHE